MTGNDDDVSDLITSVTRASLERAQEWITREEGRALTSEQMRTIAQLLDVAHRRELAQLAAASKLPTEVLVALLNGGRANGQGKRGNAS